MPVKQNDTLINGNKILSNRETEVLQLAAEGLSNKAIASRLYISPDTVDTHSRNIVAGLGAKNMKQAIAIALRNRIIK